MVQGVALELLCKLLFTEGSNPSLSVPSPNSPMLLTALYQITNIPTVRPFFLYIDSLFLIVVVHKILYYKGGTRNKNIPADL